MTKKIGTFDEAIESLEYGIYRIDIDGATPFYDTRKLRAAITVLRACNKLARRWDGYLVGPITPLFMRGDYRELDRVILRARKIAERRKR